MMSLFSSFDLFFFPLMAYSTIIFSSLYFIKIFKFNSLNMCVSILFKILEDFFLSLKIKSFNKVYVLFLLSVFWTMFLLNFFSIFSYNFAFTSQISLVLFLGFSSWILFLIFFAYNSSKGLFIHCVPEGAPVYLVWFLFFVEVISNCIRPLTITVRLVANILAGHLLMILLSKLVLMKFMFVFFYFLLNMVEIFVGLIQAYIFSTMITLYYSDVH